MPRPASSYASLSDGGDGARVFLSEVTGLVDAEVDFSAIDFVIVVAPGLAPFQRAGNPAWSVFPGRGFTRDGREIRHATTLMRAFTLAHQDIASTANHELAHSLGLPRGVPADERRHALRPRRHVGPDEPTKPAPLPRLAQVSPRVDRAGAGDLHKTGRGKHR